MKRCPRCDKHLPLDAFGRNKATRDGLAYYCRPCYRLTATLCKVTKRARVPRTQRPAPPAPVPVLTRPVTPDADFLADLADALADCQTLRGCDSPFERIQINQYGQ